MKIISEKFVYLLLVDIYQVKLFGIGGTLWRKESHWLNYIILRETYADGLCELFVLLVLVKICQLRVLIFNDCLHFCYFNLLRLYLVIHYMFLMTMSRRRMAYPVGLHQQIPQRLEKEIDYLLLQLLVSLKKNWKVSITSIAMIEGWALSNQVCILIGMNIHWCAYLMVWIFIVWKLHSHYDQCSVTCKVPVSRFIKIVFLWIQ